MKHWIATAALAAALTAGAAQAEMMAPDAEDLARWAATLSEIQEMAPKWAVQDAEAFKTSSDAGVPVFYLDVRTPKEWEAGIVEGSVQVTLSGLPTEDGMAMLPEDKNVIMAVYCKSGHRSALAIPVLHAMGYKNAISMKGGYEGWVKAGYPVTGAAE